MDQHQRIVVVGGSQAGLAVGYHLTQRRLPFVILDEHDRIGDAWRKRWDSLRLFTPGRYDSLPGDRFAVMCGNDTLFCENVVVATGASHHPRIPPFARDLDPSIVQFHSKEYRNPSQVQEGRVLIVGAGNSWEGSDGTPDTSSTHIASKLPGRN